jgi:putative endonuclease
VSKESLNLGKTGEETAVGLLKANGYKILKRNYKTKFAEIDIIARDKDTLCFIEVKTRHQDRFGTAAESVILPKQKKIYKAAAKFLKENNLFDHKARFDVVTITYAKDRLEPELIKNAFVLDNEFNY